MASAGGRSGMMNTFCRGDGSDGGSGGGGGGGGVSLCLI